MKIHEMKLTNFEYLFNDTPIDVVLRFYFLFFSISQLVFIFIIDLFLYILYTCKVEKIDARIIVIVQHHYNIVYRHNVI